MKKHKGSVKIIGNLFIIGIFLLLVVLTLEALLRFNPKYGRIGYVYDRNLIWRLNPGLAAQKQYAMGKVPGKAPFVLRFNNKGFRGKKIRKRKPKDRIRIMVLGDSYTAGLDYPDDEIFTSLLEQKLNLAGGQYEVLNISCPAWGTDQQLLYWQTEGYKYQPDYLLLMSAPNDIRELYNKKIVTLDQNQLTFHQAKFPPKERLAWFLATKSSLFRYLQIHLFQNTAGDFINIYYYYPVNYGIQDSTDWDAPLYLKKPFKEVTQSFRIYNLLLEKFKESTQTTGTQFLLAKIPAKPELTNAYQTELFHPNQVTETIEQSAYQQNIPFLNLNQQLQLDSNPKRIYMDWEFHFNQEGHAYVADQLFEFLMQHKK